MLQTKAISDLSSVTSTFHIFHPIHWHRATPYITGDTGYSISNKRFDTGDKMVTLSFKAVPPFAVILAIRILPDPLLKPLPPPGTKGASHSVFVRLSPHGAIFPKAFTEHL